MTQGEQIWALHCLGLAPSQIAKLLNLSTQEVKDAVIRYWAMGSNAVKL